MFREKQKEQNDQRELEKWEVQALNCFQSSHWVTWDPWCVLATGMYGEHEFPFLLVVLTYSEHLQHALWPLP